MGELTLTRDSIEDDLRAYEHRILSAVDRLKALPPAERQTRKHQAARRVIASEIDHINRMCAYARHAMARLEKSDSG